HVTPPYLSTATRFATAKELLKYYRDEAGLVITSRIHCAMPCAAMGIPVVYTGVREGRTRVIDLLGIPSITTRKFPKTSLKKLGVQALDFEDRKAQIVADLRGKLSAHGIKTCGTSEAKTQ